MKLSCRHEDPLAHTSVRVYSQHLELGAAVRLAVPAGDASAAVEVGLYRALVARLDVRDPGPYGFDFNAELMAQDARVREVGLVSAESVDVRSADTHAPHADERFAGSRRAWCLGITYGELARLLK